MLIVCVYSVMKTYWFKGGMIGYKGEVLNIEQDIGGPLNADINIDFNLLSQLPEGNSVKVQVNIVEEKELGQDAQHVLTAVRDTNISPIQATLGPEQGRVSGVNDPGRDQINKGYITAPLLSNSQTKNKQL
eukprot:9173887-Ditylum_brightwellii.AAC.1